MAYVGGLVRLRSRCSTLPFGLLLGCQLLIRVGVLSLLRFRGFGRFMMSVFSLSLQDVLQLDESLDAGDVSQAWSVWSRAAESALADAFRFSGGPLPSRGLILGRGAAVLRLVQLGGPRVRRARANAADALDAADVFLYCDSSLAPLLEMRSRFKAVMDLLDAMIRYGVSLSRSVELTAQWDQILALGPMYPVTLDDLSVGRDLGIGAVFDVAAGVHRRLCDFINQVVVHRRDEAIRGWRNWIREDPLVHPYRWLRPDLLPPFFSVSLVSLLMVQVFFLILIRLMHNSERLGFPTFAALGKGRPVLTNSALRLMGGCRFFLKFIFLG